MEITKITGYIQENQKRYLEELCQLIRIPSVSAQPKHKGDVLKCAQSLEAELKRIGMHKTELIKIGDNHPMVYGEWLGAPGKPTVLIYGHYDVQPEDPIAEWTTPPFEPTIKGDELFARGAADDKGQFYIHVKSVEAFLAQNKSLPINVKFLIEGEEEVGSEALEKFLHSPEGKKKCECDAVMVSDTAMIAKNTPTITYSLRGLIYMQLDIQGPKQDLHSGVYGGAVTNPALALCQMLNQMKDKDGKVMVPGFYDDVRDLSEKERKMFELLPFDEEAYRQGLGVDVLTGEKGYPVLQRTSVRPTFEVNGFLSGYTGDGAKTIIPGKAMAKISMRLVPNQRPEKIIPAVEAYLKSITPAGVTLKITTFQGAEAFIAPIEEPAVKAASSALKTVFNREVIFKSEGGSIPICTKFKKELGATVVMMGIGVPDENLHGPNEKLNLEHFRKGILASAHFLSEMATTK